MSIPLAQNFFKETVTTAWTTGAGNFYISTKPTNSIGYLVLNPSSAGSREIIKFTAIGTDGGGDYVTVTAANRGLGGTTEQTHDIGESVYMNVTAEHIQDMSDALDQIVAANAQYATEEVIGIVKMNTAPSESLGTVTLTIATPAVFTFASHGLAANDIVKFTTDGALPTGLIANTRYYIIASGLTTNTFQVSATLDGTAVDTSGTQSGTHTLLDVTPKAVGPNDPALPTVDQVAAMAGTVGTPSDTNRFVTEEGMPDIQTFTADGTWTKPAGATFIEVLVWGSGAGGAHTNSFSAAAGGGGGGFARAFIEAGVAGATETITIGDGGLAGTGTGDGGDGETSSFGSLVLAYGGKGGQVNDPSTSDTSFAEGGTPLRTGSALQAALPTTLDTFQGGWGGGMISSTGYEGLKSVYGGGGGGCAGGSSAGGLSYSGGNGGAGGNPASDGVVPGGGGGGGVVGAAGAGGAGKIIVISHF